MKIAFTAKGTEWGSTIDPRFGRTDYIVMYDEDSGTLTSVDNRDVENSAHGAGPQTAQRVFDLHPDVLITGNGPGGNAATALQKASLTVYAGAGDMPLKEAYDAYKKGELKVFG